MFFCAKRIQRCCTLHVKPFHLWIYLIFVSSAYLTTATFNAPLPPEGHGPHRPNGRPGPHGGGGGLQGAGGPPPAGPSAGGPETHSSNINVHIAAVGPGGEKGGRGGSPKRLYIALTDNPKPQQIMQSPDRLFKARNNIQRLRKTIQRYQILYKSQNYQTTIQNV